MCLVIRTMIYRYQQQKEKKRKKKKREKRKKRKKKKKRSQEKKRITIISRSYHMCIIPCVNILYIQKRNTNY